MTMMIESLKLILCADDENLYLQVSLSLSLSVYLSLSLFEWNRRFLRGLFLRNENSAAMLLNSIEHTNVYQFSVSKVVMLRNTCWHV